MDAEPGAVITAFLMKGVDSKMTLKDLQHIWRGEEIAAITALAFSKSSKKYYSFRTVVDPDDHETFREMRLGDIGDLEVKSCYVSTYGFVWGCLYIDAIEWIDDKEET